MGKKNKKLKKKKIYSAAEYTHIDETVTPSENSNTRPSTPNSTVETKAAPKLDSAEFKYVRGDVKKILLLLLAIVVLLVAIYFIDQKTHYLSSMGNWLYKTLNIQTQ